MADNIRNSNQRLKILYLCKILLDYTDEEHTISMPEIIAKLEEYGISAGRKALYDDIEALRTFGMDIVSGRGKNSGYCVVSRDFEIPELKLLADAVSSARFLTERKSADLIKKLEKLTSVYQANQIQRQVYVVDRVKSANEKIYLNVDAIQRAISEKKQITFRYFKYDVSKSKKYREGMHICSPYALTWDDGRYYLVAYYEKYDDITNFRVDRMETVLLTDKPIKPKPKGFNLAEHVSSTFSMFSGNAEEVKLRFDNTLATEVIERFGKNVMMVPDNDNRFTVHVKVKTEQPAPFFGWLCKFGTLAEIEQPVSLREQYKQYLQNILDTMK